MQIVSSRIIDMYIKSIPLGKFIEQSMMRDDLVRKYKADKICRVTTGIFLRIVSEASYEEYKDGIQLNIIAPFWRVVKLNSKLAT